MIILIKEENKFMPTTKICIKDNLIEFEENKVTKTLNYTKEEIKNIIELLLNIVKSWKNKYIDNMILDDEVYTIKILDKETKEYYIKNKYPDNWEKFILFRNKLIREELKDKEK